MIKFIPILLILSVQNNSLAKAQCGCPSIEQRQFDFWVGNWNVFDSVGTQIGENEITLIQDSCVLQENWKSKNATGTSYNYFDKQSSKWHQLWVDNSGGSLKLSGSFNEGKMVLISDLTKGIKIDFYFNQITWYQNADGSVVQQWDILDKDKKLLKTVFKGIYRRKAP